MPYHKTVGVFIGRFQPFHNMHEYVARRALEKFDRLIFVIGSAHASRSSRNPWSAEERVSMIKAAMHDEVNRIDFAFVEDWPNDERWIAEVRSQVNAIVQYEALISLVGFSKDHSSFYLKMFPGWSSIAVKSEYPELSSTDIRDEYFRLGVPDDLLNPRVAAYLRGFRVSADFDWLAKEIRSVDAYKALWKDSPFPPVFVTVDAVVVQSGHILLIERGAHPGKGQLALPGGFIDQNERLRKSAVRELKEETQISDERGEIPPAKLEAFITKEQVFDDPYRSTRGRTITHAFVFDLPDSNPMYKVVGADDAAHAEWYPLDELRREDFFEDHFTIVQSMLGL